MKFAILFLIAAFSFNAQADRETGGRRAPMAVEISFYSIGTGTNAQAKKEALKVFAKALAQGKIQSLTEKSWGLEGESTICVEFKKFEYVYEMNDVLKGIASKAANRTNVKITGSCDPNFRPDPRE